MVLSIPRMAVLAFLATSLFAQSITITSGPANEQVLQRDGDGRAEISLSGAALKANNKFVEARVLLNNAPVAGLDWTSLGKIQANKWKGELKGLPTGGPYKLEVRLAGAPTVLTVENLLVGDLWVLAGQSNMEGVGDLENLQPRNEMIHSFDQTDKWVVAEEPLHRLVDAADRVHWRRNAEKQPEKLEGDKLQKYILARKKGAGLGLPFASEMFNRTGIPIGLLPCAHGGTSMDQWSPSLKDQAGDSLYGSTIRRIRATGGKVRGILWYQGESDASPKAAPEFQKKFEALVASFREDLGISDLRFYYVQIGRFVNDANPTFWNDVQESQRLAEGILKNSGMVAAVDLSLDDRIHVSTPDLKRLGRRLANLACHDLYPTMKSCGQYHRGPRPLAAKRDGNLIRLSFTEVNGKLVADGRFTGFVIQDDKGSPVPAIYKIRLDPTDPTVLLLQADGLPEKATIRYGFGKDPYCNLRDEADMGAPVFGPLQIQ